MYVDTKYDSFIKVGIPINLMNLSHVSSVKRSRHNSSTNETETSLKVRLKTKDG